MGCTIGRFIVLLGSSLALLFPAAGPLPAQCLCYVYGGDWTRRNINAEPAELLTIDSESINQTETTVAHDGIVWSLRPAGWEVAGPGAQAAAPGETMTIPFQVQAPPIATPGEYCFCAFLADNNFYEPVQIRGSLFFTVRIPGLSPTPTPPGMTGSWLPISFE